MTLAPKRIFTWENFRQPDEVRGVWSTDEYGSEYVRADLFAALLAERDALAAQLAAAQAERDALIAAGELAWAQSCENHAKEPPMKYMAPYGGLVSLRNAIDQIGLKQHSLTPLPPDRIWIDAHGGNWSDRAGGTQEHEYVREDLLAAAELRATQETKE